MRKVGSNIFLIGKYSKDGELLLTLEFSKLALFVVTRWLECESLVNLKQRVISVLPAIELRHTR